MGDAVTTVGNAFKGIAGIVHPDIPGAGTPPPTPSPTGSDADKTNTAMNQAAAAETNAQGRAATMLTGGQGDTSDAPTSKRVLLGS